MATLRQSGDLQAGARVRLDKWLWAARFFRTRTLAKQAIESGHVRYNGDRPKVSKEVDIGGVLTVRQGWDEVEVVIRRLSDRRGGAPEARLLYSETAESITRREAAAAARRASAPVDEGRPTKKQRRLIQRLKRG
jgi:ribosome-associated heat shock protein Hsp15